MKRGGLMLGKLPPEILKKHLLGMTGAPSEDIVVPPSIGVDFGVVRLGSEYLIVSSDPVTGVRRRIGWYAVNVSANDIATSGNRPRFMQSVILLPEDATEAVVRSISSEMHSTAKDLGITIVGGHTELTPRLKRPVVVTTAFAVAKSYVTAAGGRAGDTIMMTKTAGVEGTAILGTTAGGFGGRIDGRLARAAGEFFRRMSVVDEAGLAYGTGAVDAMHDCTEGGVLGAVYEMAYAAGLGLEVSEAAVPVARETRRICSILAIDPLRLISSGTLLLAVQGGREREVEEAVAKAGVRATAIGKLKPGKRRVLTRLDGSREEIPTAATDEIWRVEAKGSEPIS